jgi:hypothetical protein
MMEIVCRAYVEDGWAYFTTEAGDRKWGGKFNAKEAEERGGSRWSMPHDGRSTM